jgi:hypothetical protein
VQGFASLGRDRWLNPCARQANALLDVIFQVFQLILPSFDPGLRKWLAVLAYPIFPGQVVKAPLDFREVTHVDSLLEADSRIGAEDFLGCDFFQCLEISQAHLAGAGQNDHAVALELGQAA